MDMMESPLPPPPPAVQRSGGVTSGTDVVASGSNPPWTLVQVGDRLVLQITGEPLLEINAGHWRVTLKGRRISGSTKYGPIALDVEHGLCRVPGGSESGGQFAFLTLADGRRLRGCAWTSGGTGVPYPGRPYLDRSDAR